MLSTSCGWLAVQIETAMFKQNKGVNAQYKTKYRSLSFNLKDSTNPDLRRKVLDGTISGACLVEMAPEDMASDARKVENAEIRKKADVEKEPSKNANKASTDAFKYAPSMGFLASGCCCWLCIWRAKPSRGDGVRWKASWNERNAVPGSVSDSLIHVLLDGKGRRPWLAQCFVGSLLNCCFGKANSECIKRECRESSLQ